MIFLYFYMFIKALRKVSGMGRPTVGSGHCSCSFFFIKEIGGKSDHQILSGNAGSTPAPSILIGGVKKYERRKINKRIKGT